ncbi:MAG: hypothetical protein JW754_02580 [Candidatus Aenigmarchaeota archaeon]|nr:hypothetical protein [Candidatus Aenigmarchaeota archaeon]
MSRGRLKLYLEPGCDPGDVLGFLGLPKTYPVDFKSGISGDEPRSMTVPSQWSPGAFDDAEAMRERANKFGMVYSDKTEILRC